MLKNLMSTRLLRLFSRHSDVSALARVASSPDNAEQKNFFDENGYLILRGFFSEQRVMQARQRLDALWRDRAEQQNLVIDTYFGQPNPGRMAFRKAPADCRQFVYKLMDVHLEDEVFRDLCTDGRLMQILRVLLGAHPLVCNSLLFERGSQQGAHFDTFFMPSKTPNMMAATWIALDRVTDTNGPLFYYPGSHLIPPYLFSHGRIEAIFSELETGAAAHIADIIERHHLKREVFKPEPGDVLIWHAQLLHGGSPIANPMETRRSLVSHYWTDVDFPEPEQRIDLGDERWVLRKSHQYVIDEDIMAEVDAFLATISASPQDVQAVPGTFDARKYLAWNQDVLRAGVDPWRHYREHGQAQGRVW